MLLSVRDTGHGIPPDVHAHLFEPFFTTKEAGKGTGLGLATVLGIVGQSGGHVHAVRGLERGACFEVFLPAVEARGETAPPPVTPQSTRGSETVNYGTLEAVNIDTLAGDDTFGSNSAIEHPSS